MDGGAEGVQHLHLLQHVLPAGGADDEQLPPLQEEHVTRFILIYLYLLIKRQTIGNTG